MRTHHQSPDDLLSAREVSAYTGIPVRTLGQWRYLRRGPAFLRLGQHVRYRRSDLDAWIEAQRVDPSAA